MSKVKNKNKRDTTHLQRRCRLGVFVCMCAEVTLSTAALVVWLVVPGFSLHIWANSAQTEEFNTMLNKNKVLEVIFF